jgi:CheY-like chemotaxis protein/CheY-specific phosphatase CheX
MNVLVVEDEPTTRMLLRRVLEREFDASVTEAANGNEAIEALARSKFAFVVLDLQMPVMDGVETLEAVRRFPELGALPIIVMTVERNEARVRRVVELGISDYLTKPLDVARVVDRIRRLVTKLMAASGAADPPHASSADGPPLVVVDGRAEFRRFVAHAFGPGRTVIEADSGMAALKACFEHHPAAVLVGSDIGVIGPALLARKLRRDLHLSHTRVIGLTAGESRSRPGEGDFDGFVPRTASSERFVENVLKWLGPLPPRMAGEVPMLREELAATVEQVMGMLFGTAVEVSSNPALIGTGPGVEGRVRLSRGADAPVDLVFSCRHTTAQAMGVSLAGGSSPGTAGEAIESAITTLCNVVAGRLRHVMAQPGREVATSLPVVQFAESLAVPPDGGDGRLDLSFQAASEEMSFRVSLVQPDSDAGSAAA